MREDAGSYESNTAAALRPKGFEQGSVTERNCKDLANRVKTSGTESGTVEGILVEIIKALAGLPSDVRRKIAELITRKRKAAKASSKGE